MKKYIIPSLWLALILISTANYLFYQQNKQAVKNKENAELLNKRLTVNMVSYTDDYLTLNENLEIEDSVQSISRRTVTKKVKLVKGQTNTYYTDNSGKSKYSAI